MSSSSSSSTSNNNPSDSTPDQTDTDQSHKPMLTLPAPGDVEPGINLEVNGKDIKLDALGPVVVNVDGTMSRIDNWAEMSEIEKSNVRRILLKRNDQRLQRLRAERDAEIASNKSEEK
ncbi:hypothetical protein BG006_006148 [Podila minutissima]|uniref:Uncharacterized protein n=1 Tax=Podila minutissima TaxID=64525 RepID=A0A9P5VQM1_9FUNG|nr:hypothetical protein BG006_006148 [Podila minutissima]